MTVPTAPTSTDPSSTVTASPTAGAARSAVILTGGAIATQIIGVIRILYLASFVGAAGQLDPLLIALALPGAVSGVITSGAATALVPAYLEARAAGGRASASRFGGLIITWAAIGGVLIGLLLALLADSIVSIAGPRLAGADLEAAIRFLRLFSLLTPILSVSAILGSVCQAEQRFVTLTLSAIAGSATTVGMMVALWSAMGMDAFAVGSVVGPAVALLVLVIGAARASVLPRPTLVARDLGVRAYVRHALPLSLSSAVLQLNVIVESAIANLIGPGGVSVLRYAEVLIRTPIGAIGPAWGTAIYPTLVESTREVGSEGLARTTMMAARYATAVFVPVAFLTASMAPIIVSVAYLRGEFTEMAVHQTAPVVAAFAPLMVVLMISPVLTGALNALRRGTVLLAGGVLNVVVNAMLAPLFAVALGFAVPGIALSSSLTPIVVATFFARRLGKSEPSFRPRGLADTIVRACCASLPVAVVCALIGWSLPLPRNPLLGLMILAIVAVPGAFAYALVASRLGLREPMTIVELLGRRLRALISH